MSASTGQRPANNFDILRLIAASAVIFAHGFSLYGYDLDSRPTDMGLVQSLLFNFWRYFQIHAGTLGVYVFFLISGYLIAGSIIKDPGQWSYWQKRLLRIMPGLVVCIVLTAFVMGPLVTSLPLASYFSASGTYLYLLNITIYKAAYDFTAMLPGVFRTHPLT